MTGIPRTDTLLSESIPGTANVALQTSSGPPELDFLAQLARDQLERERAWLEASVEELRQVWAALRENDQQALHAIVGRQTDQEQHCESIRHERNHFRQRSATILRVPPEDVHFGLIIQRLREAASTETVSFEESVRHLAHLHAYVQQKIQEAEQLRDQIANLTSHCLSFLNRFLLDLTGGVDGGRYSPAGIRPEAVSGALIEMRG